MIRWQVSKGLTDTALDMVKWKENACGEGGIFTEEEWLRRIETPIKTGSLWVGPLELKEGYYNG